MLTYSVKLVSLLGPDFKFYYFPGWVVGWLGGWVGGWGIRKIQLSQPAGAGTGAELGNKKILFA